MADAVVHGLTVHAYAAVYAAASEGFPLELVLEHVGIAPADWAQIDEAWSTALAEDVEVEGPLSGELELALSRAQESYRRPIPPLDEEIDAWIRFSRAWGAAPEPTVFLKARGLETNDLVRLHRGWSARVEKELGLQKRVAELMQEQDPVPPTFRKPAPLELRLPARKRSGTMRLEMPKPAAPSAPSLLAAMPPPTGGPLFIAARPAAPIISIDDGLATAIDTRALVIEEDSTVTSQPALMREDSDATIQAKASPFDSVRLADDFELPPPESVAMPSMGTQDLSLAQYASLRAELETFPDEEEAIFAKYGLASRERRAKVDAAWQERLGSDTDTYAEWRQLYRHFSEHWAALGQTSGGA